MYVFENWMWRLLCKIFWELNMTLIFFFYFPAPTFFRPETLQPSFTESIKIVIGIIVLQIHRVHELAQHNIFEQELELWNKKNII